VLPFFASVLPIGATQCNMVQQTRIVKSNTCNILQHPHTPYNKPSMGLITRRSPVRIWTPLPIKSGGYEGRFVAP